MNLPMFSNDDQFRMLKKFVLEAEKESSDVEKRWERISKNFKIWESTPHGTNSALLSHKMYFLELLFEEFPLLLNRENERIANIVFPDTLVVGQELAGGRIVRREITNRGGLLLTLEKPDGTRFSHEVLD